MTTKDPAMLGGTNYARVPLDFYPTPPRATEALISIIEGDLEGYQFWEPFAGNGAIYNIIAPFCRQAASSDIAAYEGFDADAMIDFFNVYTDEEDEACKLALESFTPAWQMKDLEALFGFRPDLIISNPPYGDGASDTERSVRHALKLMEAEKGMVIFLMRHEWDTARGRSDLLDHPAFSAKITLRFRPVWIEKKPGEKTASPRFSYAWYVWDFSKALTAPGAKAQMFYAG